MTQVEVYEIFKMMFCEYHRQTVERFQNGKNSIRVRLNNGSDFIFTFNSHEDWCFESLDSHIRRLKGG